MVQAEASLLESLSSSNWNKSTGIRTTRNSLELLKKTSRCWLCMERITMCGNLLRFWKSDMCCPLTAMLNFGMRNQLLLPMLQKKPLNQLLQINPNNQKGLILIQKLVQVLLLRNPKEDQRLSLLVAWVKPNKQLNTTFTTLKCLDKTIDGFKKTWSDWTMS